MMPQLPDEIDNIYPRTLKNIESIFFHYFKFPISETKKYTREIYDKNQFSLNQIEYLARVVSENMKFFKSNLKKEGISLKGAMGYVIAVHTISKDEYSGSVERKRILNELYDLVEKRKK